MDASSSTVTHPPAPPPQITPENHNSQNASYQPSTSSSSQEASHLSNITSTSSVHLPSTSSAPALLQSADLEFPRPPIRDESLGEAFLLYWKIRIDSIFKGLENKSINQLKYHDFETYRQIALLRISSHLKR